MAGSLLTTIRDLHRRRARERRGLALAEGVRLLEEALAARVPIRGAAVAPGLEGTPRGTALKSALERAGVRVESVSDAELESLADTDQPQGVVAVIEPRQWRLEDLAPAPGRPVLVLDAVQDPGNVGTILRTTLGHTHARSRAQSDVSRLHAPGAEGIHLARREASGRYAIARRESKQPQQECCETSHRCCDREPAEAR